MAAELSLLMGQLKKTEVSRVRDLLGRAGLPVKGPALAPERMLELMSIDKKAAKGKARFVVLESIGCAALRGGIDEDLVRKAIVAAAQ
jgi:3-dehydroquinate synthase